MYMSFQSAQRLSMNIYQVKYYGGDGGFIVQDVLWTRVKYLYNVLIFLFAAKNFMKCEHSW